MNASLRKTSVKYFRALIGCFLVLTALSLLNLITGPQGVNISPSASISILASHLTGHASTTNLANDEIIWNIRLPRVLMAGIVGALLGIVGVMLQGLIMNPLADPYTVGVSSGAAVGATLAQVAGLSGLLFGLAVPAISFACGLLTVVLVYRLAQVRGHVSTQNLLLAGVVVGTMLWSLIPLMLTLSHQNGEISRVMFTLLGTVSGAEWSRIWLLAVVLAVTYVLAITNAKNLDVAAFGEKSAESMGVDGVGLKKRIIGVSALATAATVSVAGIIAFVGLIVPHIARQIAGPAHRTCLPLSALIGACLLIASDWVVRVYLNDMPVGVITSLIGAPLFCVLLKQRVLNRV